MTEQSSIERNAVSELREHMDNVLVDKLAKKHTENPKVKPLTREQRRFKERVEREAMTQLNSFAAKFYEFFMENDPESEAVAAKKKELSAKWKMYVHDRKLNKEAGEMFDGVAQKVIDKYNQTRKGE